MPTQITASGASSSMNRDIWHKIEVHRAPWLGRPTAALPTVVPERRFIIAFPTRVRATANEHCWPGAAVTGTIIFCRPELVIFIVGAERRGQRPPRGWA